MEGAATLPYVCGYVLRSTKNHLPPFPACRNQAGFFSLQRRRQAPPPPPRPAAYQNPDPVQRDARGDPADPGQEDEGQADNPDGNEQVSS